MPKKELQPGILPTRFEEMHLLGWDRLDIILITGDTYIDAPSVGAAVIGRVLLDAGYRVGIIAQPDIHSDKDISRLGEPTLFWGITAGCMDSMIANYTASGKRRKRDDLTPGGRNTKRPDRAIIVYTNLIRRHFKNTLPIVLGGIEAGLRRISHYDVWSNSVRRSILFDAKADILVYGMAEQTIVELAEKLKCGQDFRSIRGICYIHGNIPSTVPEFAGLDGRLADHKIVSKDKEEFIRMFQMFYENLDPLTANRLYQRQDTRYLVVNPPSIPLSATALDRVYELPYTRDIHPFYKRDGPVRALETVRFSLTTHRGCYGECRFCAITAHQGRHVVSRSEASLVREASGFSSHPDFKGIISDVGGPTANMYGFECERKKSTGACKDKGCIHPEICRHLPVDHGHQIRLLKKLRGLPGVRKVFIGSGLRYDLILHDRHAGERYLTEILHHHVSGQLKIAPEHVVDHILKLMGKPDQNNLEDFMKLFGRLRPKEGSKIFLTYYLMAAHPGCSLKDMESLREFALRKLRLLPEQVQIFTPGPSTYATLMYHTEKDPFSKERIFVEKNTEEKIRQKQMIEKKRI